MNFQVNSINEVVVCRTCLKALNSTGFTYLDDENGYIPTVGNIREMLQFCVPELDLCVSSQPVICHQCLPILVQVHNFKIKCLDGESTIKNYILRNNLEEYIHVNLNSVLNDEMRLKKQNTNNRIKHIMIQDQTVCNNSEANDESDNIRENNAAEQSISIVVEEEYLEQDIKEEIEINEPDLSSFDEHNNVDGPYETSEGMEVSNNSSDDHLLADNQNMVAVRKDLFDKSEVETKKHLNKEVVSQNGNINIKTEQKILENIVKIEPEMTDRTKKVPKTNAQRQKEFQQRKRNQQKSTKKTPKTNAEHQKAYRQRQKIKKIENKRESIKKTRKTNAEYQKAYRQRQKMKKNENKRESSGISEKPMIDTPPPLTYFQNTTDVDRSLQTDESQSSAKRKQENSPAVFNCNQCSYATSDVIKIYDHNRSCHHFYYTCELCPFSTSKVEVLGKHMSRVHPEYMAQSKNYSFKESYVCTLCPFSVKSIDLLRSHHLTAHSEHTQQGKKNAPIILNSAFREAMPLKEPQFLRSMEYTCNTCSYATTDKSNFDNHVLTHGSKFLRCQFCKFKCFSPNQLRKHVKQKHSEYYPPSFVKKKLKMFLDDDKSKRQDDDERVDLSDDSTSQNEIDEIRKRRKVQNKIRCQRYREKKKKQTEAIVNSQIYKHRTITVEEEEKIKRRKEYDKQKSQRYRDKKRATNSINLHTDQSSETVVRHVSECQNLHNSQIAGPSTRNVPYVLPIHIADLSTLNEPYIPESHSDYDDDIHNDTPSQVP